MAPPGINGHRWRQLRLAVLERDGWRCYRCGKRANTVDHKLPRSLGGTNMPDNLRAACGRCNYGRRNRPDDFQQDVPQHAAPSRIW